MKKSDHDPSLAPTNHAYSGEVRKGRKGDKDEELCWYCGEEEHKHNKKVKIVKGKRLIVPVE
ncbi:MAG: hypothetical protein ACWGQW_01480 [bacterium]